MTSTAHALVAGAIVTRIPDPFVSIPLAFISHFVLDSIPHWDFGTNWRERSKIETGILAIGETLFGILISYGIFGSFVPLGIWAMGVSVSLLPDWLEIPWYIFFAHQKKREPAKKAIFWERFWYSFYKLPNFFHAKAQLPIGIITQVVTVAFFFLLLNF